MRNFLTDEQIKEMIEFEKMCELEVIQEAWDELQSVPSYVEQQARQFVDEIEKESK